MVQFSFTEDLYTGSNLIDGDHHKLVEVINAFFESMQSEDGARMSKALHALIAFTGEHFAREEIEMERIQYVAALAHKGEHTKLLKQIAELDEMLDAGDFLNEWLRDHILAADMKLAAALKKYPKGELA